MIEVRTADKIHHAIASKIAGGASYIDALVDYAAQHQLEVETVAEIVKKSTVIKEKIRQEAQEKRLLKRNADPISQICD